MNEDTLYDMHRDMEIMLEESGREADLKDRYNLLKAKTALDSITLEFSLKLSTSERLALAVEHAQDMQEMREIKEELRREYGL